jgi:hypothetical protein
MSTSSHDFARHTCRSRTAACISVSALYHMNHPYDTTFAPALPCRRPNWALWVTQAVLTRVLVRCVLLQFTYNFGRSVPLWTVIWSGLAVFSVLEAAIYLRSVRPTSFPLRTSAQVSVWPLLLLHPYVNA